MSPISPAEWKELEESAMRWFDILSEVARILGNCTGIIAFIALIIKPVREFLFGTKALREAQKCMLRSDMLHTYYKHRDESKIRQHEKENFIMEYSAYKHLGGNSFIDDIEKKVRSWEVVT